MHVNSCFDDFWKKEVAHYSCYEGAIFCSSKNEEALIPFALVRNCSDAEALSFCLKYWESCCRLSRRLGLSYISMRIANTLDLEKQEDQLIDHDYSERICVFTGSPERGPQNGYFVSVESRFKLNFKDGMVEPRKVEQSVSPKSDRAGG